MTFGTLQPTQLIHVILVVIARLSVSKRRVRSINVVDETPKRRPFFASKRYSSLGRFDGLLLVCVVVSFVMLTQIYAAESRLHADVNAAADVTFVRDSLLASKQFLHMKIYLLNVLLKRSPSTT